MFYKYVSAPLSLRQSLPAGIMLLLLTTTSLNTPVQGQTAPAQAQATPTTPANATVYYVNPTLGQDQAGAGAGEGTPFRTITYALQQANPGSIIVLAPGTYTVDTGEVFPLTLKPRVTLRGNPATKGQTVSIIGGDTFSSSSFGRQSATIVTAPDSRINGVSVTNPKTRGTGVWVESTNPVIENSTFKGSFREGIFVTGSGTPTVKDSVFTQNSANGISVVNTAQGEYQGNLFENTGFGVAVGGDAAPRIINNTFTSNRAGLVVSDAAQPVVRQNQFVSNREDGIVIAAFATAQPNLGIEGNPGENVFQDNGRYAIYNAARNNPILAVGNQVEATQIAGDITLQGTFAGSGFADVRGNWAASYIQALAEKGILGGFPDGTFRPNEPVTRAQFAAIIEKAFDPAARSGSTASFSDVSPSFWGYNVINSVARSGFMSGYPGNIFRPNQEIPRVQVIVALANGLNLTTPTNPNLSIYQDAAQIPDYAREEVAAATQRQIVVNYPVVQQLQPLRNATRAEVAAFVYQALVNAGKAEPIASPYVPAT